MNKQRKRKLLDIKSGLIKYKNEIQKVLDEEQNAFDNMPENLQGSFQGSESEDAIDIMEKCIEDLENIIKELTDIT